MISISKRNMIGANFLNIIILFLSAFVISCSMMTEPTDLTVSGNNKMQILGWNSYDGFAGSLDDSAFIGQLDFFSKYLKPAGYQYLCVDANWDLINNKDNMTLDTYGRSIPAPKYFPDGLTPLIQLAHSKDIKVGLWIARGISRKAVSLNTPILGTSYHASDIASLTDTSSWLHSTYGVDMTKPGAQEWYNSVINLVASWGIDFIKYDDIVPHPDEISAVKKAIDQCGRDIILSLSPGNEANPSNMPAYNNAQMVRITSDAWDNQTSIDKSFSLWKEFQFVDNSLCLIDLDMVPFGRVFYPEPHLSYFSDAQKRTFITQRAMAASPIMLGGDLTTYNLYDLALVTNSYMLECNKNGQIGQLVSSEDSTEIWKAVSNTDANKGWLAVFNRKTEVSDTCILNIQEIGIQPPTGKESIQLYDIWSDSELTLSDYTRIIIPPSGCYFFKY